MTTSFFQAAQRLRPVTIPPAAHTPAPPWGERGIREERESMVGIGYKLFTEAHKCVETGELRETGRGCRVLVSEHQRSLPPVDCKPRVRRICLVHHRRGIAGHLAGQALHRRDLPADTLSPGDRRAGRRNRRHDDAGKVRARSRDGREFERAYHQRCLSDIRARTARHAPGSGDHHPGTLEGRHAGLLRHLLHP